MMSSLEPIYLPILRPTDAAALEASGEWRALVLSAVYGVNERLEGLCSLARERARTLLVDPKTPHFQFEGYMSMPDYRDLDYGAGGQTLGRLWRAEAFRGRESRSRLIESVFEAQERLRADLLMAPYFYLERADSPWLDVAHACGTEAVEAEPGKPVVAPLCVDIDAFLDEAARQTFLEAFRSIPAAAYWINVVNYDEQLADPRDMRAVRALVDGLCDTGRPVILAYAGRTGLLAVAAGARGYAAGAQGWESHPRSYFREMMGTTATNSYYLPDCLIRLPARLAEAALDAAVAAGVELDTLPCPCPACEKTSEITMLVSRQLARHALLRRRQEVAELARLPPGVRMANLRDRLAAALDRCHRLAGALDEIDGGPDQELGLGRYHYLEVILETAGGPPATLPDEDHILR